ncbi:hypothetical protein BT96DRAFT_913191 [Gymnopus androsaceus JB14]|uniref:RlpA-like protein double-psi beta-barrel domain-containing protein n=1 Tax=Gymnopus androsaceus JB14 TaxID=1447944 RepID=A0A6A4IKJ0_9AGAR|nr:hypothetical protein BT96DRAFT_913191 [Gymnopus androsaceus JB14]
MYARALAVLLSAAVVAPAAGYIVPRKATPSSYATGYLEPYQQLREHHHHKGAFFSACCHPLLAIENLETARPSYCIPSTSASSSASAAEPTSTVTTPADGDHHDDDDSDSDCDDSDSDSSSESTFTSQPRVNRLRPLPLPLTRTMTRVAATTSTTTSAQADPTHGFVDNAASESSAVFTGGQATYFYQNGVAGACGNVHSDYDWIVAIGTVYCGKTVTITGNGVTKQAMVADDCPTCSGANSLDMSLGLFEQFASLDEGVFPISWSFVN